MAIAVEMPKMSDTMDEGILVSWVADEGDAVSAGDVIAQVETDKATMDLEVYDDGVLLKRVANEGDAVPIGGLIAVLGEEGEDVDEILSMYGARDGEKQEPEPAGEEPEPAEEAPEPEGEEAEEQPEAEPVKAAVDDVNGRAKASPLARKIANERGIDLSTIKGTGPEGRIVKRDLEGIGAEEEAVERPEPESDRRAARAPAEAPARGPDEYETVRISQMRKTIARRLAQSKFTAPHFYLTVDVNMEQAIAFRAQLNDLAERQDRGKVSFNDLITKASALALRRHPPVNSSYLEKEGEIRRHRQINIAVAVAVDEGLLTPVIRNADQKGLAQIAEETREFATRARDKKLEPADWEGSTFTTSNLGMFGIEEFTAIINPPNSCILAIGAIRDVPVVEMGQIVPGKRMKLTLSCDHRIVDGATGAQFLQTVAEYLEEPMNLLL